MKDIKEQLFDLLKKYNGKVATAESCTGGLVAGALCDISGISSYFEEGYITYSESAKIKNLGVSQETIEHYGVVSIETAMEMAIGASKKSGASYTISTTGIAGPAGGTSENPVGTVCFACVVNEQVFSKRVIFTGDRKEVRMQATEYALEFLLEKIIAYYDNA